MTAVGERYMEQVTTTAETLRRRLVSYYDGVISGAQRLAVAAERAKEIIEPASYDLHDYATVALASTEPATKLDKEFKNTLVEMYLGLSAVMVGLSAGMISGGLAMKPVLDGIFDTYVEVALIAIIPIYVYLVIKKTTGIDDIERRTCLFVLTISMGVILGHLMPSLVSMSPAVQFIPTLVLALLVDNELIKTPIASMDRYQMLGISSAISVLVGALAGAIPIGYVSTAIFLNVAVNCALLGFHYQLCIQTEKDKMFSSGDFQFAYVATMIIIQVLFAAVFGVNPSAKEVIINQQ